MVKRILLAEDEPNIVESISFLLKRAGLDVDTETDGVAALSSALENTPDVVILDVMMPGIDGFEALRRLRADERGRDVPVVVLSAKGQRTMRETAEEAGANVFMAKPFSNAELVDTVLRLAGEEPT